MNLTDAVKSFCPCAEVEIDIDSSESDADIIINIPLKILRGGDNVLLPFLENIFNKTKENV